MLHLVKNIRFADRPGISKSPLPSHQNPIKYKSNNNKHVKISSPMIFGHLNPLLRTRNLHLSRRILSNSTSDSAPESTLSMLISQEVYDQRKLVSESYHQKTKKSYPGFEFGIESNYLSLEDFIARFEHLEKGKEFTVDSFEKEVILYGRIYSKRQSGKKLVFYSIQQGGKTLQVILTLDNFRSLSITNETPTSDINNDFVYINESLRKGDIIAIRGIPARTNAGELSLRARSIELVSPCLHSMPNSGSLTDKDIRYRFRHVDMLVNNPVHQIFLARSTMMKSLRNFLDSRGFIEVETPILSPYSGGASARPFSTHMIAQDAHLYMRIAPELYLKQLVIGGMEKVYEIGKSFRNEGVDSTHNPEFTTCEFYQAYTHYEELMETTQDFLKFVSLEVNKKLRPQLIGTPDESSVIIDIPAKGNLPAVHNVKIDFSKPFRRIYLVEEVEKQSGRKIPDVNDASNAPEFEKILSELKLTCSEPKTTVRMFDVLVEHFVEPQCIQPTFLCNFPLATSPLAREHRNQPGSTERFELFIARMELANAYTELNDPVEQRKRFENQMPDGESVKTNEDWFCGALEWGLPPTGGWGLGLDRLSMILTNNFSIKEVILFPYMKPLTKQEQVDSNQEQL